MTDTPSGLRDLQAWMQTQVMNPTRFGDDDVGRIVRPSSRLDSVQRLAIYQRAYLTRLLKCMSDQFPALRHALGDELFDDFAMDYLTEYPSMSYTLFELGARLPRYLDEHRPDRDRAGGRREPWIDFMIDLARFERQLFVLFDAHGHEGKPFATQRTPPERMVLQPCFALGSYRFPVATYYHDVRLAKNPGLPPAQPSHVALVRRDYLTHTYRITGSQHAFLSILTGGLSVAEGLQSFAHEIGRSPGDVHDEWESPESAGQSWIAAGFFVDSANHP